MSFLDAREDRIVAVTPQPQSPFAVFIDAPEWVLGRLAVPVLMDVYGAQRSRFLEVFIGTVDFDRIRLTLGHKWPVGGRIFVGGSTEPLSPGRIAQLAPGMLVRVFPPRVHVHRCHTLEHKMLDPPKWFRPVNPDVMPDWDDVERHVGLVGVMGDWATIPANSLDTTSSLCQAIEERCGYTEDQFLLVAPAAQQPDLYFRGDKVVSTLAVLPRAVVNCCALFLDARALAVPVTVLFLPFAEISLDRLLRLAGCERPYGLRLQVRGTATYRPETEVFVPAHKASVEISVDPVSAWGEDSDVERDHTEIRSMGPNHLRRAPAMPIQGWLKPPVCAMQHL